jgi:hypothetical protein
VADKVIGGAGLPKMILRLLLQSLNRQHYRGVAERSNAAVLKTVEPQGSGGSNPSSSANQNRGPDFVGVFVLDKASEALG